MFASHTNPDATTPTSTHSSDSAFRVLGRRRTLAALGTGAVLALALTACGSSGGSESGDGATPGMHHGPATTPSSGAPHSTGPFNDADVAFAQQMIPHHQQALEMARLADGRAADSEVRGLATAIGKAQKPEIDTMKGWLASWGRPLPSSSTASSDSPSSSSPSSMDMPGMNHGSGGASAMPGMMADQDMRDLASAKGKDFDQKFSRLMISHHQGAVAMAKDEQKNGDNPDAKRLAGNVIAAQNAEIEQMNKILARLK